MTRYQPMTQEAKEDMAKSLNDLADVLRMAYIKASVPLPSPQQIIDRAYTIILSGVKTDTPPQSIFDMIQFTDPD